MTKNFVETNRYDEHLMEEARKKGNYFEFKDITGIAHDEKNRKQFIIHDVHYPDARFRCPSEKEAKAWVEGLTLAINDDYVIY